MVGEMWKGMLTILPENGRVHEVFVGTRQCWVQRGSHAYQLAANPMLTPAIDAWMPSGCAPTEEVPRLTLVAWMLDRVNMTLTTHVSVCRVNTNECNALLVQLGF